MTRTHEKVALPYSVWVSHGHRLEFERLGCGRSSSSIRWSGHMPRFTFFGSRTRSRASRGQRTQDVDRPAEIQALPEPARARRPRVQSEALGVVPRPEGWTGSAGSATG